VTNKECIDRKKIYPLFIRKINISLSTYLLGHGECYVDNDLQTGLKYCLNNKSKVLFSKKRYPFISGLSVSVCHYIILTKEVKINSSKVNIFKLSDLKIFFTNQNNKKSVPRKSTKKILSSNINVEIKSILHFD